MISDSWYDPLISFSHVLWTWPPPTLIEVQNNGTPDLGSEYLNYEISKHFIFIDFFINSIYDISLSIT